MILFYNLGDPFGCFSNFSRHPVDIYGHRWRTSEHPFQAMKFSPHRPDLIALVRQADTPGKAARIARDRSLPLRPDWEAPPSGEVALRVPQIQQPQDHIYRPGVVAEPLFARTKDVIMYEVVLAKFQQNTNTQKHLDIQETLLDTGTDVIVENAEHDPYWGWGASQVGENKLGRILMAVREVIRCQRPF